MTRSTADIFVSYKNEDRPRVQQLVNALEADGFTAWWDAHIGGGANWREDIEQNLDTAKCVIVVWSKRSVGPGGEFVRDEAARARRHGTYLPIRLEAVDPPLGFGEVQALSLKGWRGNRSDDRYAALLHAVRGRVSGERPSKPPTGAKAGASRRTVLAGGAAAAAAAAGGAFFYFRSASADAKRIAVLPFANLSGDQNQAYFPEGVAEELRAALSRVGMQVIGRASSEAVKDLDTKAAAAKLGVANILTGSVRRSPEVIRVNAQLIGGGDGVERWSQAYDRAPGDAIKIQTDIAEHVVQALRIALGQASRAALVLGGTADSEAQDLLLQARKLLRDSYTAEAFRKGLELADAAIVRDPNYADAYVERAFALSLLALNFPDSSASVGPQIALANAAAERALAIAPKLGSAYAILSVNDATVLDFGSALKHLKQAIAFSPEDPNVLIAVSNTFPYLGDPKEAARMIERFVAVDPLNPNTYRRKAETLFVDREYSKGLEAGLKAVQLGSTSAVRMWTGFCLLMMGRVPDALRQFGALPTDSGFRLAGEGIAAAKTGDNPGAERKIARIKQLYNDLGNYQCAQVRSQMKQADAAFAELEKSLAARDPGLIYLKADPFMDPVRNDPRFAALVRKLRFP